MQSRIYLYYQKKMYLFIKYLLKSMRLNYSELLLREAIVLDVRTQQEFLLGHIDPSVNIPLSDLPDFINELKEKKKPIITCCLSGSRSERALTVLKNAEIEAYNGGSWRAVQIGIMSLK